MKEIIKANFYPVLTWHPRAPRPEGKSKETEIWEETAQWDPPGHEYILWLASPDKKVKEPIDYLKNLDPKHLEAEIREILKKHEIRVTEPKE
jgi:hypothetical protein